MLNNSNTPSVGAIYHKCALQVNPPSYSHFRGEPAQTSPESHVRLVVEKAVKLGISAIAVTNHNSVSEIPLFLSVAENAGLRVFPGFELKSSEGVHVLCIYEIGTEQGKLERYLGEFGIHNTSPSTMPAKQTFVEILKIVRKQGGLTVAAHATQSKGLLKVLQGHSRINVWKDKNLLAIQIPGTVEELEQNYLDIVENRNPAYRREHPADENLGVAVVNAKDVTMPDDLENPASTCWVKMSRLGIEGLKQAFLDPGSRIRLNTSNGESPSDKHAELVSIAWKGGFLDEVELNFNSNLNVLIGGRGTGKSTIIESIRTVLGLDARSDAAAKEHRSIVQNVLKNGTKITLMVRIHEPVSRMYRIERTIPNPPRIIDENGELSNLLPEDLLTGIEIFGQHEILSLTKDKSKLTQLLDRFAQSDNLLSERRSKVLQNLEVNRRSQIEVQRELEQISELLQELPRLKERLQRLIEAGYQERLQEQSHIVHEERIIESVLERIKPFQECLTELKSNLPIDSTFISPNALKDLPGKSMLEPLNSVFEDLEKDIVQVVEQLERVVQKATENSSGLSSKWQERKRLIQANYEKILREMQVENLDGEEFIDARRRIEVLRPLEKRQETAKQILEEHSNMRKQLLAEWEEIKSEEFHCRSRAAMKINKLLGDRVKIELEFEGDSTLFIETLRVGGMISSILDALESVGDFSLPSFVSACQSGKKEIMNTYGVTEKHAEHLANIDNDLLMQIEELEFPTTTIISLNVALPDESPHWRKLDDLSTGQKATAVLLLLLLESRAPLIIDQPEDDLDNRFISEDIVPKMREEKQRRQFIFSTHNANIPVLGDAELICGLSAPESGEYGGARIKKEHLGSIDDTVVRELVEQILEGGEEAFERRRRKYGF